MAKPLRVLIVEDSEDDALLVIRELERGSYDTTSERVETAEAMTDALEKQVWDIIIADYKLPHFSAPEALELFHQSGLDLPFIVISGTIGEETAVAIMKDGAHDYLMKDNLKRLVPAIERELHEVEVRKERKLVQEELQIAEQNFRNSIDNSPLGIRIVTAEGELLYTNQAILDIYGYNSVEELKATPTKEHYTPKSYAEHQERIQRRKQGKPVPASYEVSIARKDGEIRQLITSRKAVVWGGEVQYQVIYQDITERKRAEEETHLLLMTTQAIGESQDFYAALGFALRKVCETTGWNFGEAWVPSRDGKILECSPTWYSSTNSLRKFRKLSEEFTFPPNMGLPGRIWSSKQPEWIPDVSSESEAVFLRAQIALESGLKAGFGVPIIANGQVLAVLTFFMFEPREEDNRLVELVSAVATQLGSVIQRKRAEDEVKRAAEEWRTTFNSITDSVSICDKDFRLIRVNQAFADVVKMKPEKLIGKHCYEVFHGTSEPIPNCPHKQTIKTKKPAMAEFFEPHLGIHLEVATSPIFNERGEVVASVHIVRDITERRNMQQQLILTDRLASIGELSSGIAHELNNPLTAIIGFSDLLLGEDISDDIKEDLEVINREAKRTAGVVRNLLTFARGRPEEKQLVDINKVIQNVLDLRAYEQRVNNIEVDTQLVANLPEVLADGFQLQQVFLNIVINAEHFMSEAHGRGRLTVTTEWVGDIVRASFADDGPGIPPENLSHLFNPFFTTKEVGKGTGLGLSISYGIISAHDGRIYTESELGKGATFVVELPVPATDDGGKTK